MPNLTTTFRGITAPNPFWLASGPPTNTADQVRRAFDAGWGGAVWKTITDEPVQNAASRYGGIDLDGRALMGLSNIELISDRPFAANLAEIAAVKKAYPKHALFVSIMVRSDRDAWRKIVRQTQDAGADGLELNFGCPHGMNERGMGSAVGQVPEYTTMVTEWVKNAAAVPVMVKLTPNVTDIQAIGRAAVQGGADALSLINTINSIIGVDLDTLSPKPTIRGASSHGGYSGPAIKPIALHMVAALANDREIGVPISGIGGIQSWQDAAEFLLLGAASVQICTAVMHHGFRLIEHLTDGLSRWMNEKRFERIGDLVGKSSPRVRPWGELDLNYKLLAEIDQSKCIHCGLCYAACEDGAHQAIRWERVQLDDWLRQSSNAEKVQKSAGIPIVPGAGAGYVNVFTVKNDSCVGCNLCQLVCPVAGCVTMRDVTDGKAIETWSANRRETPRISADL
jgi:dihydropyrimidine dehydrogenase (NAD+) subunit PreA